MIWIMLSHCRHLPCISFAIIMLAANTGMLALLATAYGRQRTDPPDESVSPSGKPSSKTGQDLNRRPSGDEPQVKVREGVEYPAMGRFVRHS